MMDFFRSHRIWERNGNIPLRDAKNRDTRNDGRAVQPMVDSNQSSQNVSYNSDWNSNQFLSSDMKQTDQKILDDSFLQQYGNANRDYLKKSPSSPASSPTGALYGVTLRQKDLSYDDLSKNIDANLAEIDMETFRSEDINSILALPAIYTGDFQSQSHGEQCASVSGSLLSALGMDSSMGNRHSEDDISISKDEPLFSPLREPPATTISIDSLDNSSSYEQDLVLTCKANKNNYTIVFEGSSTQFSDDSDYQDVCRSSEEEGSLSGPIQANFKKQSSMVQSDVAFTTWSKLWKSHRVTRRRSEATPKISNKSQSLPNLSQSPVFITDKQLNQWAKWCGTYKFPLYEIIQGYQATGMHVTNSKECMHSVSLLKLFMRHRVSSNSSIGSSGQSDSSTSLILQPLNFRNASLQNSLNASDKVKPLQRNGEETTQKDNSRHLNDNDKCQLIDNIQILDWNSETNNNNINSLYSTEDNMPNNNNIGLTTGNEECDNSQYFEDSLMDTPSPPLKHFHATPIKEEEETDISSGDEVMRDSKNPFGSDESSSGEITIIQNNVLNHKPRLSVHKKETATNLERINNILHTQNSNGHSIKTFTLREELKKPTVAPENHSQSTQTKQFNINDGPPPESFRPLHAFSCKTSSNQTDCDVANGGQYTASRDSSPASSGYVSSRHSSVERIRPPSQSTNTHPNCAAVNTVAQKSSVVLTTTCTCGTQIPVHVKDSSVQTTTLSSSNSSSGFTLKESTTTLPEPNIVQNSSTIVKVPFHNVSSQTKHRQRDKKSVYVCYPNYSLPDLSFLKSVIDENSESLFLTPTEYKLPQEILNQKRPSRPKSYGAYESLLQKHLTKIKDWESLNVLLPDDLKVFLSKTHSEGIKAESSKEAHQSKLAFHPLSSSFCNYDDATKIKVNMDSSFKRHMPRSILRKSSSVEQCEDRHCKNHLPTRCTSASSVLGTKQNETDISPCRQVLCKGSPKKALCEDFLGVQKSDALLKKYHPPINSEPKQFSPCTNIKRSSPLTMFPYDGRSSPDKKILFFENGREENFLQDLPNKGLFIGENTLRNDSQGSDSSGSCSHSKKAVKFCERSPTKSSKHLDTCRMGRCCSCDMHNKSPDGFHGSHCPCDVCADKPPHEFLVSPTSNPLLHSDIADSYVLQNFSGGGKFFQEALRRKTGLVENLRKATQIIFEHHKNSYKKGIDSSVTMGQKILTWLCPAVHTILSDGLLPSVQGFFGPLLNSPWKVAGASVKQGDARKEVEDLLHHVNSEKLLTDSTYRFNAFILGLLNLGCFEWWLGHLCACHSLICHHYHPTALLSLLALPAAAHLRHELKELVSPLSSLPFHLDILFETKGDGWKKYDEGNFRPDPVDGKSGKGGKELNLHFSPHKHSRTNDFSLKSNTATSISPCGNSLNIQPEENQVWPGITINPFPNAKFAEELHCRQNLVTEQGARKLDAPFFPLCSSADSGCSSQVEHAAHPNDASPCVDVKEGQGFKLLRQKWEKMSHANGKVAVPKTPTKSPCNKPSTTKPKSSKKPEVSPPRMSMAVPKTPAKTYSQTPPARRRGGFEVRSLAPDVVASSQVPLESSEKKRSHIPTLKMTKAAQPKSMIPVQKVRARSANRDVRFTSD